MSDSLAHRLRHGIWREWCAPDWLEVMPADWRDTILTAEVRDQFHAKQGRTIARWDLNGRGRQLTVYLKRHYRAAWWDGWAAALGFQSRSSAWQEADHLRWAAEHWFVVPRIAAVGEQVGPWCRLQSFLALEELTGCLPLHRAVPLAAATLPPVAFAGWKRGLAFELARLVARLHWLQHFHKDLYFCHFYVPQRLTQTVPRRWHGSLAMIDLHRLGHHPWAWRWWQLKDLAQLAYSSDVTGVTARDRVRFWRLYAGPERRRGWWPWLRRGVMMRWKNYRRHHENRLRRRAA
jgi:heptose I phosphotransferase